MRWNTAKGQLPRQKQRYPRRQRGAAIAEFVVVLPALLVLGLGSLQSALFYQAKTTVTYAAFEAARKGATLHGQKTPMLDEFGLRLAPVFGGDGSGSKALHAINKGQLEARDPRITGIDIINPTHEAFLEFGTDNPETGKIEIPNSHLKYRDATRIGASSGVNVQDANLLKIKITYGFALTVPLVNGLVTSALKRIDPQNAAFYDQNRIPISAVATVRMQSEAWEDGNLSASGTPPGGGVVPNGEPGAAGTVDTGTDDPTAGQGDPLNPVDPFQSNSNRCDSSVQSCLDNPANQGNPNSCSAAGNSAASTQTAKVTGLPATGTGNPIHVVSGNKYQVETDFAALPGPLGLVWQRHYNSQSRYRGGLGTGWRHSYDVQVRRTTDGMRLIQSDGRHLLFKDPGAGRYQSALTSDGWLTVAPDNQQGDAERITWHWRNGQQLQFNAGGQLTDITLPSGAAVRLQYNDEQRLFLVRDAQNRELSLGYYPNGRLRNVLDTTGQRLRYTYDDRGNLAAVTYADATTRHYHYADKHDRNNLTGITDQRGVRFATWAYDEHDRAISSEHAGGVEKVSVQFNDDGTRLVTDSQGQVSTYFTEQRQGLGLVTGINGPGCSSCGPGDVRYEYDAHLRVIAATDKQQVTQRVVYDKEGRISQLSLHPQGGEPRLIAKYAYAGSKRYPSLITEPSVNPTKTHQWWLSHNNAGQVTKMTEVGYTPDGKDGFLEMERSTRYTDTASGQLASIDGQVKGDADKVSYRYTAEGQLESVTDAYGSHPVRLASEEKDRLGRVLRRRHDDSSDDQFTYDTVGRLIKLSRSQAGKQTTEVELDYNASSHITAVHGPKGTVTADYDDAGRPVKIQGVNGERTEWRWDSENRLVTHTRTDADGTPVYQAEHAYDADGRLSSSRDIDGGSTHYQYDDRQRLAAVIDPLNRVTRYAYTPSGALASRTRAATSSTPAREKVMYDVHGRVEEISDPRGNKSRQRFDDFGHKLYAATPDGGVTVYRYNAWGRVIAKTDESGVITRYDYDDKGRLIGVGVFDLPAANTLSYVGTRLNRDDDPYQHTRYEYNVLGDITVKSVTFTALNKTLTTRFAYNAQRQLVTKVLPDGTALKYHYDAAGRPVGIERSGLVFDRPVLEALQFDRHGRLLTLAHGNNEVTEYHYDATGRLSQISALGNSPQRYQYDRYGKLVAVDSGKDTFQYSYDELDRLIGAQQGKNAYSFAYDPAGNRLSATHNGAAKRYKIADSNNRLLAIIPAAGQTQATRFKYRRTGEVKQKGGLRYELTLGGRPSKVYRGKQLLAAYRYNSQGERIRKIDHTQTPARTTYYLYDNKQLVAELDETGKTTVQYLYLGYQPVALLKGKRIFAIHTDHRSAPVAVTDKKGRRIWSADYAPFGKAKVNNDPDHDGQPFTLNLRLPGQYEDSETATYYNMYRDYDPQTGRYLQSDPLGIQAGLNTYAYVKNDPLNRVDPLGLYDKIVHYDMTYFLAVVAGLDAETAKTLATATQYIDDSPVTRPIHPTDVNGVIPIGPVSFPVAIKDFPVPNRRSLPWYHFTNDYDSGPLGDPTFDPFTRIRRIDEQGQPTGWSSQLQRLYSVAMRYDYNACLLVNEAPARRIKTVLFGEFLHAFEDSFAHRDRQNRPIDRPLLGHGPELHSPDYTFNHQGDIWFGITSDAYFLNEMRTLEMERETFITIRQNFVDEILANRGIQLNRETFDKEVYEAETLSLWAEMSSGKTPLGAPSGGQATGVLQRFNAMESYLNAVDEEGHEYSLQWEEKTKILDTWLEEHDHENNTIQRYEKDIGQTNRRELIDTLNRQDNPEILFPAANCDDEKEGCQS